jgi:hypothetical protein
VTKLENAANERSPITGQWKNARTTDPMIGPSVNRRNPIPLGARKPYAAAPSRPGLRERRRAVSGTT